MVSDELMPPEELILSDEPDELGELMVPEELGLDVEAPAGAVVVDVELPLLGSAAKATPPRTAASAAADTMIFSERMFCSLQWPGIPARGAP